ncbi:hypothetical protein Trydic_g8077 [Trypoxylus dichotomus]
MYTKVHQTSNATPYMLTAIKKDRFTDTEQRRPRPEESATLNEYSYQYKVRMLKAYKDEGSSKLEAFISLHGVTNRTVQTRKSLARIGTAPVDMRARDHSYLECNENMALVKQKSRCELLSDSNQVTRAERKKSCSFSVVQQDLLHNLAVFLKPFYVAKYPLPTDPITEVKASQDKSQTITTTTHHV